MWLDALVSPITLHEQMNKDNCFSIAQCQHHNDCLIELRTNLLHQLSFIQIGSVIYICLCSVPNGTCAGSGPTISRITRLHKQSSKSWFHTGSGSPSFLLTCMTSFAEFAFPNALRFPKAQGQGKSKLARLHKQSVKSWYTELPLLAFIKEVNRM